MSQLPDIFPDTASPLVPGQPAAGTAGVPTGQGSGAELSGTPSGPAATGGMMASGLPDLLPPDDVDDKNAPAAYSHSGAIAAVRMAADSVSPDQMAQDAALGRKLDMPHDMISKDRPAARRLRVEQDTQAFVLFCCTHFLMR